MNTHPQYTNRYYALEFSATEAQLELQRDIAISTLKEMAKAGEAYLERQLFDEETDWSV